LTSHITAHAHPFLGIIPLKNPIDVRHEEVFSALTLHPQFLCLYASALSSENHALISVLVFYDVFADSSSVLRSPDSLLSATADEHKFLPSFRSFALRKTRFSSEYCVVCFFLCMDGKRDFLVNFGRSRKVDVFKVSAPSLYG
jgi:hypothetical protein